LPQLCRVLDDPPEGFETLRREAAAEGYDFLDRLADEIAQGRYSGGAELPMMLAAFRGGGLVALGGLTADPYDSAPDLARIRHVYVRQAVRRSGIGRILATALIQQGFAIAGRLSLRAADAGAASFWEAQGFVREIDSAARTHLLMRSDEP
jgi:GNAT superfamily N-acetyltransferase